MMFALHEVLLGVFQPHRTAHKLALFVLPLSLALGDDMAVKLLQEEGGELLLPGLLENGVSNNEGLDGLDY